MHDLSLDEVTIMARKGGPSHTWPVKLVAFANFPTICVFCSPGFDEFGAFRKGSSREKLCSQPAAGVAHQWVIESLTLV
jgi:hypothetical protein